MCPIGFSKLSTRSHISPWKFILLENHKDHSKEKIQKRKNFSNSFLIYIDRRALSEKTGLGTV